jgi:hypothetical protein
MCVSPNKLPDGSEVVCRKCEQCVRNKINDWVGRNIAESKVADKTFAVTLTYGRNEANETMHERAVVLTFSDFQKYMKRLRRHGYNVRYFVTGEYGSLNGRAHWHAVLYFNGGHPDYQNRRNFMQEDWKHGWSFWDAQPDYSAVRYCCKYVMKHADDEGAQTYGPQMSKKPPIGYRFFEQRAEQFVKDGLAPQDLEYSFPDVRFKKKDGTYETMKFWLRGRSAELFLDHFIKTWRETYPTRDIPPSELVELYIKYGKVVKDESKMLTRQEFPNGERFHGRPWPTSQQIRSAVEAAENKRKEAQSARAVSDIYRWHRQRIREAPNGKEKERRSKEYEQFKNARDAEAYERIAAGICKKYKIPRKEFDAQAEQYQHEKDADTYC